MALILLDFLISYFDFAASLVASLLALMAVYVKRAVFFQEPVQELATSCMLSMLLLTMNLTIIHMIITKVGFIYTEVIVLRKGNDETFSDLNEGVIIFDK